MFKVSITRGGTLGANLAQARQRVAVRVQPGLVAAGGVLLERSFEEVPKDTYYLSQTGELHIFDARVCVSYGSTRFPPERAHSAKEGKWVWRYPAGYAWLVHETREVDGRTYAGVPYLRGPANNNRPEMRAALLAAIV